MNRPEPPSPSHEDRLGAIIAQCLGSGDDPASIDIEALVGEHPQLEKELREFFEVHHHLAGVYGGAATTDEQTPTDSPPPTLGRLPSRDDPTLGPNETASIAAGEVPLRFGDYELLEEISRGGMGVVYRARQVSLGRVVALKMILTGQLASPDEVHRFRMEAEAAARLDHPAIVPIYEIGVAEGQHFFSMAFVGGGTLTDLVANGPLDPRLAAEYVSKIADAVAYAHEHGIIHRDLKPSNVLLDSQGEPKITDFGLAKHLGSDSNLTATGQVLGTPAYMPPEQAAGIKGEMSPQVDVYALGAILYHLMTGKPPFQAENPIDIVLQVLDREPVSPSKAVRGMPRLLERICQRAMEKRVEDRYPSAAMLADDLRRFLKREPVELPKDDWWHRCERWWRKEPLLLAHLGGIFGTLGISWAHKVLEGTELAYIVRLTTVFLIWAVVCFALQKWLNRTRHYERVCFVWGACDIALFTWVLHLVEPPRGILLVGYAVLIASSSLFLRVRYVWFMTISCLATLMGFVILHPDDLSWAKPQYAIVFSICLAVIGLIVGSLVRQVRVLRQYYEHDE